MSKFDIRPQFECQKLKAKNENEKQTNFTLSRISKNEEQTNFTLLKFTVFSSGSFCQIHRVTDEALIAETMVCPNFFLTNVFFALKGFKLFIIYYHLIYILDQSPTSYHAIDYDFNQTGVIRMIALFCMVFASWTGLFSHIGLPVI